MQVLRVIFRLLQGRYVIAAVAVAAVYYLADAAVMTFVFREADLWQNIVAPTPDDMWMRTSTALILIVGTMVIQRQFSLYRQSEDRYRGVMMNAADGIVIIDHGGIIEAINPAIESFLGWSEGDLIGRPVETIIPSPDRERHAEYLSRYLETGNGKIIGIGPRELFAVRKDGAHVPMELSVNSLRVGKKQSFVGIIRDTAERTMALQALNEEKARAEEYLNIAGSMILALDAEGRITLLNDAARQILECQDEDIIGKRWLKNFAPAEEVEARTAWYRNWLSQEVPHPGVNEVTVVTRSGKRRLTRWHNRPITDQNGKAIGVLCSGDDITEPTAAAEALAASEARYARVVSGTNEGIWEWNIQNNEYYVSPRWAEIVGVHVDDLRPSVEELTDRIHPDDKELVAQAALAHVKDNEVYNIEYRLRHGDGHYIWVQAKGQVTRDEKGEPLFMAGSLADISERKNAEEALIRSEASLANAQRLAQLGNWDWNIETGELHWSKGIYRIFGYSPESYSPNYDNFLNAIHPEDREHVEAAVQAAIDGAAPYRIRHRIIRPSGDVRFVDEQGEILRDEDGAATFMTGAVQDVTEQVMAERALIDSQEQLHQAQKMEAVGQLSSGIAHDFNNMLAVVLGNLEMAIDHARDDKRQLKYLELAQSAAQKGSDLTQTLLTLSMKQILQSRPVDVNLLIDSMADLLQRALGSQVKIARSLMSGLPAANLDPAQFESAILNIALNARDAMPDGGVVEISTSLASVGDGPMAEEMICIAISDRGLGMDSDVKSRALEPFFTTKAAGKGTGLGLSMVYSFVQQAGGQMTIDSEKGQGTRICLYFPISQEPASIETVGADDSLPQAPGAERILIVEDEPQLRALIKNNLESLGYRTIEAVDGSAGLAIVESRDDIDLVLSDIVMPNMSGDKLVLEARKLRPDLKCLFMSGFPETRAAEISEELSRIPIMRKPFTKSTLARTIFARLSDQ